MSEAHWLGAIGAAEEAGAELHDAQSRVAERNQEEHLRSCEALVAKLASAHNEKHASRF